MSSGREFHNFGATKKNLYTRSFQLAFWGQSSEHNDDLKVRDGCCISIKGLR